MEQKILHIENRIHLLENRAGKENQRIVAKLKRMLRAMQA